MKNLIALALLAAGTVVAQAPVAKKSAAAPKAAAAKGTVAKSYKDLRYPALNKIQAPTPEKYTLGNGITVFLLEDHELPFVSASATIRVGDRWEPADKAGLASIAASVMRTGGTPTRSGDQLDDELDRLAASVEIGSGSTSSSAGISVLKEDAELGFTILADVLRNPAFPQDKIDLEKLQFRDSISRRNDNANGIHGRELRNLMYGKNGPYTRQEEYATIDSITRDDLVAWHKRYYQPENMILGVWGDFKATDMKALINRTLGALPRGGNPKPIAPTVDRAAVKPGMYFVEKDDVNQSTLGTALLLGQQNDPDYPALSVMTTVLGGGFSSRLFSKIRTEMGLAYAASAGYGAGVDYPGVWSASVRTKSETTAKALEAMRAEIARIATAEVTEAELQLAKDAIIKGAAFDNDSTGKIIRRLMGYEYYGLPADFLETYRSNVEKTTRADVLRVAKQYLGDQEKFVTLVLGNSKEFDRPLTAFGAVTPVDASIPPPTVPERPVAALGAGADQRGKELLARAKRTHGGDKLDSLHDMTVVNRTKVKTAQGEIELTQEVSANLDNGKTLSKTQSPVGEVLQGFDGESMWLKTPQGVQTAPASAAAQARATASRQNLVLLRNFDKPGVTVAATGPETIGGKTLEGVRITNTTPPDTVTLFIDSATGELAAKRYVGALTGAPGELTEIYSNYVDVGGIKLPGHAVILSGGKEAAESNSSNWKLNPGLADSVFARPAQ
jgi:predicted Zn-dependent peptidase